MSNSLELTGKLLVKYDTQHVNDKFKKREFVVELTEEINGNSYTNYAKLQLVQQKCDILDRYAEGEDIVVQFNIKGNRWERDGKVNFITNLDAWQIRSAGTNTVQQQPKGFATDKNSTGMIENSSDNLPF